MALVERMKAASWTRNLKLTALVTACWLALFLAGRLLCTTLGDATLLGWLFDTDPKRTTYLFGWLTGHGYYLWCSILSIAPALFGKYRFSFVTFAGFAIGFAAGELLGAYPPGIPYGHGHYGWAIWGGVFLGSIIAGIAYEAVAKKLAEKKAKSSE